MFKKKEPDKILTNYEGQEIYNLTQRKWCENTDFVDKSLEECIPSMVKGDNKIITRMYKILFSPKCHPEYYCRLGSLAFSLKFENYDALMLIYNIIASPYSNDVKNGLLFALSNDRRRPIVEKLVNSKKFGKINEKPMYYAVLYLVNGIDVTKYIGNSDADFNKMIQKGDEEYKKITTVKRDGKDRVLMEKLSDWFNSYVGIPDTDPRFASETNKRLNDFVFEGFKIVKGFENTKKIYRNLKQENKILPSCEKVVIKPSGFYGDETYLETNGGYGVIGSLDILNKKEFRGEVRMR